MRFTFPILGIIAISFLTQFEFTIAQKFRDIDSSQQDTVKMTQPEKQRAIQDWRREQDAKRDVEEKLPSNLQRMGPPLRDLIKRMKDAGITRENASSKEVVKIFSTEYRQVDSLGRILIEVSLSKLDEATVDEWLSWGVAIEAVIYPENKVEANVIKKLKSTGAYCENQNPMSYISIDVDVPFDRVEEFAKLSTIRAFQSFFPFEHR